MKVIVFDLDDTLYDELTYVKSGFQAVAEALAVQYNEDSNKLASFMWEILCIEGRGKVFDLVLKSINQWSKKNVKRCVSIYRLHSPQLQLHQDALKVLQYLQSVDFPCYIVTDGNKLVQQQKLQALGIESYFKKCYITHRYGKKHAKPSPYCFNQISRLEKVEPVDIVYVGDNIAKDFVGIKPLGYQTIQIMRGSYTELERSDEYHADYKINSLIEIIDICHV